MNPMVLAALAQFVQKQQQQGEARDASKQGIAQNYAGSLGYPMHGVQAARDKQQIDRMEGPNYMAQLLQMRQRGGQ